MPPFEIFQHLRKLQRRGLRIETEHPVNDMIGPRFVGPIEISRLGCRFERTHDDARRIGPQVQGLSIEEYGLRQGAAPSGGRSLN